MIFQRVNRSNAERVFIVMKANEANIAADDVVQLDFTAASVDGANIVQPNSNELMGVVGVADAAIANGAYGLVQIYGYRSTSKVLTTASSYTAGLAALKPVAGQDYFHSAPHTEADEGILAKFIVLESVASTTGATNTASAKIFIRAM